MSDNQNQQGEMKFVDAFCKEIQSRNGGSFFSIKIHRKKLEALPVDDHGYVKLTMFKKKQMKDGDKTTHFMVEDTYVYTPKSNAQRSEQADAGIPTDDLPF